TERRCAGDGRPRHGLEPAAGRTQELVRAQQGQRGPRREGGEQDAHQAHVVVQGDPRGERVVGPEPEVVDHPGRVVCQRGPGHRHAAWIAGGPGGELHQREVTAVRGGRVRAGGGGRGGGLVVIVVDHHGQVEPAALDGR